MRKENISIAYDSEKLSAVKMYMEQRDTDLKSEIEKSLDALYTKYVPANVREYLDMKSSAQTVSRPKTTRSKPSESKSEVSENV